MRITGGGAGGVAFDIGFQDVCIVAVRHDVESTRDVRPVPLCKLAMELGVLSTTASARLITRASSHWCARALSSAPQRVRAHGSRKSATHRTLQIDLKACPIRWHVKGGADESTTSIAAAGPSAGRAARRVRTNRSLHPESRRAGWRFASPRPPPPGGSEMSVARQLADSVGRSRRA